MLDHAVGNLIRQLWHDTRGDETVSSVGRLAFIGVPLIVALIALANYVVKNLVSAQANVQTVDTSGVKSQ